MKIKLTFFLIAIHFLIYVSGCATVTGPSVSREEIEKTREELKVKALAYKIKQMQRLYGIGNRLMQNIPAQDIKYPAKPYIGMVCLQIDKYLQKVYNLDTQKGVVIVAVLEKSPAAAIGLQPGDVLLRVNGKNISTINYFNAALSGLGIGEPLQVEIMRGNQKSTFETKVAQIPINTPINMVDWQEVNAATDGKIVVVTYGLVNFAKSDDEIAAVIGHELAHAARGHILKAQGGQIISLIAALTLGAVAENSAPGTGNVVARGVSQLGDIFNASYSRDLEREADYFGTRFVYYAGYDVDTCATVHERFAIEMPESMTASYFSTHPSSPERVARIKKEIEELKSGGPK
jgi:Zn-dependent protease with chaperone function